MGIQINGKVENNKISMYMIEHKINMIFLLNLISVFSDRYMRNLETSLHPCLIYAVPSIQIESEHKPNKSSSMAVFQK